MNHILLFGCCPLFYCIDKPKMVQDSARTALKLMGGARVVETQWTMPSPYGDRFVDRSYLAWSVTSTASIPRWRQVYHVMGSPIEPGNRLFAYIQLSCIGAYSLWGAYWRGGRRDQHWVCLPADGKNLEPSRWPRNLQRVKLKDCTLGLK